MGKTDLLTSREKEVLSCLKHARTSREIAGKLHISERTVKFHIGNIMRKLNVVNRTQAVAAAMEQAILDRAPD